ncbi:MAG: hypothetical protein LW822_04175 [Phycisphaeraceae bacterium]|nr:hypothetical protein [Phycisphaeraceae bacterium]
MDEHGLADEFGGVVRGAGEVGGLGGGCGWKKGQEYEEDECVHVWLLL